jgi:TPR repeat protein
MVVGALIYLRLRRFFGPVTASLAVVLLAACAHPGGAIDQMACASPIAPQPSTDVDYAALSIDQLKDRARIDIWGKSDPVASRIIAQRYDRGDGVPQDMAKAALYYEAAAIVPAPQRSVYVPGLRGAGSTIQLTIGSPQSGDPVALYRLGELYAAGLGVKKDERRAQILLSCAAQLRVAAQ